MKVWKRLLCLALVLVMVMSLAACGGSDKEKDEDVFDLEELAGYYPIYSAEVDGETLKGDALDDMFDGAYFTVDEDGEVLMHMDGEMVEGELTEDGLILDGEEFDYEIDGKKITIEADTDLILVFRRSGGAAPQPDEEDNKDEETDDRDAEATETPDLPAVSRQVYYLYGYTDGYETEYVWDVGESYEEFVLEIYSDGTGLAIFEGEEIPMLWEDDRIWPEGEADDAAAMEIDGSELILSYADESALFSSDVSWLKEQMEQATEPVIEPTEVTTYFLVEIEEDGESYNPYALGVLSDIRDMYIDLYSNDTAVMYVFGESQELAIDGDRIYPVDDPGDYIDFEMYGDEIALGSGSEVMIFTCDEEEALEACAGAQTNSSLDELNAYYQQGFYGWWTMTECTGEWAEEGFEEAWWDIFAVGEVDDYGELMMYLWDEDFTRDDPLAVFCGEFDDSQDFTSSVEAEDMNLMGWDQDTDYVYFIPDYLDEDGLLWIYGYAEDSRGTYRFDIYMRPWGASWEDLGEDWLPYYYEACMVMAEAGEPIPDSFDKIK